MQGLKETCKNWVPSLQVIDRVDSESGRRKDVSLPTFLIPLYSLLEEKLLTAAATFVFLLYRLLYSAYFFPHYAHIQVGFAVVATNDFSAVRASMLRASTFDITMRSVHTAIMVLTRQSVTRFA